MEVKKRVTVHSGIPSQSGESRTSGLVFRLVWKCNLGNKHADLSCTGSGQFEWQSNSQLCIGFPSPSSRLCVKFMVDFPFETSCRVKTVIVASTQCVSWPKAPFVCVCGLLYISFMK